MILEKARVRVISPIITVMNIEATEVATAEADMVTVTMAEEEATVAVMVVVVGNGAVTMVEIAAMVAIKTVEEEDIIAVVMNLEEAMKTTEVVTVE